MNSLTLLMALSMTPGQQPPPPPPPNCSILDGPCLSENSGTCNTLNLLSTAVITQGSDIDVKLEVNDSKCTVIGFVITDPTGLTTSQPAMSFYEPVSGKHKWRLHWEDIAGGDILRVEVHDFALSDHLIIQMDFRIAVRRKTAFAGPGDYIPSGKRFRPLLRCSRWCLPPCTSSTCCDGGAVASFLPMPGTDFHQHGERVLVAESGSTNPRKDIKFKQPKDKDRFNNVDPGFRIASHGEKDKLDRVYFYSIHFEPVASGQPPFSRPVVVSGKSETTQEKEEFETLFRPKVQSATTIEHRLVSVDAKKAKKYHSIRVFVTGR